VFFVRDERNIAVLSLAMPATPRISMSRTGKFAGDLFCQFSEPHEESRRYFFVSDFFVHLSDDLFRQVQILIT